MFDYEAFILFCHCISTASASGFSGLFTSVLTGLVVQCLLFFYREYGDHLRHGGWIEEGAQSDAKHTQTASVTKKGGMIILTYVVVFIFFYLFYSAQHQQHK